MPRKKLILTTEHPYHITARCINREWFRLPLEVVWDIFSNYLFFIHYSFNARIHLFVLMQNHFHLIMSTPDENLDLIMNYFMREVSRAITDVSGRINQTFGGPYHWCIIHSYHYYLNAYKYVYYNPVKSGLSEKCEDYKFSSLNGLLGQSQLIFPIQNDFLLNNSDNLVHYLNWLNKTPSKNNWDSVSGALSFSKFSLRKDLVSSKENILEKDYL